MSSISSISVGFVLRLAFKKKAAFGSLFGLGDLVGFGLVS
jgi:hypothetical protein